MTINDIGFPSTFGDNTGQQNQTPQSPTLFLFHKSIVQNEDGQITPVERRHRSLPPIVGGRHRHHSHGTGKSTKQHNSQKPNGGKHSQWTVFLCT
jgi:hypothetical protein